MTANVCLTGRKLLKTGFFHIFGSGVVNKVLATILSVALVRLLSKNDYGAWAYAFNIASFFVLFNGLGASSALLQIGSELAVKDDPSRVERYATKIGLIVDIVIGCGMALVALTVPLALEGSNQLLLLYCVYPLLSFLFDVRQTVFRIRLQNKLFARMTNVQTLLNVAFSIGGAIFAGSVGLVVGQQLALLGAWVLSLFAVSPSKRSNREDHASDGVSFVRSDFWKIALMSALNNGLSQALTLVGTFLIGLLLASDSLVADYKVATTVPFALLFLPSMVCTYVYPYFARNSGDKTWCRKNFVRLEAAAFLGFGGVTAVAIFLSEPTVRILFGDEYAAIAPVYNILMLGFFFASSLRQISGNLLVTQRKLSINFANGVVSIIFNVIASVALIPSYGLYGAAWVYALTMLVGGVIGTVSYMRALEGNSAD